MLMPFGPYKDFEISMLPDHHTFYLIERVTLRKPLMDANRGGALHPKSLPVQQYR